MAAWSSQVDPWVDKSPLLHRSLSMSSCVSPSNLNSGKDHQGKDFGLKKRCPNQPRASQVALLVKNPPTNAGNIRDTWVQSLGRSPGRSPGEGNGNPLQYSGRENLMDRGAWWATVCVCVCVCVCVLVTQSSPTLCNPMDCSPQGSFVHGILQARILECVAISFPATVCRVTKSQTWVKQLSKHATNQNSKGVWSK